MVKFVLFLTQVKKQKKYEGYHLFLSLNTANKYDDSQKIYEFIERQNVGLLTDRLSQETLNIINYIFKFF